MSVKLKVADFLSDLNRMGITVWAEGGNLRFTAPKNGLSPDIRAELIARKSDILTFLRPGATISFPATAADAPAARLPFVAPHTSVEKAIAHVWQRILSVDDVGIHDIFFEQGGDSVLATQLVSWIRQTYEVEVPLRELFAQPTVAGLAESIAKAERTGQNLQRPPLLPIPQDEKEKGSILSFAQQRSWFLDQLTPENPFYNMPKSFRLVAI